MRKALTQGTYNLFGPRKAIRDGGRKEQRHDEHVDVKRGQELLGKESKYNGG